MTPQGFESALRRLVDDEEFAQSVQTNPDLLTDTYVLSQEELDVLGTIWRTAHPESEGLESVIVIACYVACKAQ